MSNAINKQNLKQAVPFFMVTNMERSLEFYVKGLGFDKKLDWSPAGNLEWCYLEREAVGLMLQEYRKDFLPQAALGLGVSICILSHDALKLYHEFTSAGLSPDEPFVGNGMWVTNVKDPDGYALTFESLTDVAEETKYFEWKSRHVQPGNQQDTGSN